MISVPTRDRKGEDTAQGRSPGKMEAGTGVMPPQTKQAQGFQ